MYVFLLFLFITDTITATVNVKPLEVDQKHHFEKRDLNSIINMLPMELHLHGYRFCGPGTRLSKKLDLEGINELDNACKEHDIAYSESSDLDERSKADMVLERKAWERAIAKDASSCEKMSALVVTRLIKTKRISEIGRIKNPLSDMDNYFSFEEIEKMHRDMHLAFKTSLSSLIHTENCRKRKK
nr:PREDICTED: uncharacterized protein LOC107398395 [Tribolium castaneum]|eukprot:XP_015837760.1 PREDICTED: uncharacterized protein LOC107398395 [Tribolium castaneum]